MNNTPKITNVIALMALESVFHVSQSDLSAPTTLDQVTDTFGPHLPPSYHHELITLADLERVLLLGMGVHELTAAAKVEQEEYTPVEYMLRERLHAALRVFCPAVFAGIYDQD
jgi:hypothetical protein